MTKQAFDPNLLILISLAEEKKHGYSIMEDIEQNYSYNIGPGTLYGALKRLEDKGYIRALLGEKKRRPYELTLEGKTYLDKQLSNIKWKDY